MKVDYYLPPMSPGDASEQAERAVRLGYDGFFSAETSHDPFLPLAVAAKAAPSLELGTAIAVAFARTPMTVAHTAWDLASSTGGKFMLGLGTQVKGHITRRFSMPWDSPVPRMREFIAALRAIWSTWQDSVPLRFEGEFYRFSLMTPFFDPGPIPAGDVPVYIAGVGPYMARLAGEVCQGFHVHPFHTQRYLDEVTLPRIAAGAKGADRDLADVEIVSTVFCVTGVDESEMASAALAAKQQIAFYASTPAYRGVLDLHDWDFGPTLTAMSKKGEWGQMTDVISDEVLNEVAVVAPIDELGSALRRRYSDRLDRIGYYAVGPGLASLSDEDWADLISATRG